MQGGWQDSNVRMLFVASTLCGPATPCTLLICRCGSVASWIARQTGGFPDGDGSWTGNTAMILAGYYVKRYGKRRMMVMQWRQEYCFTPD